MLLMRVIRKPMSLHNDELAQLQKDVNKLQQLTETLCKEKIANLASGKT